MQRLGDGRSAGRLLPKSRQEPTVAGMSSEAEVRFWKVFPRVSEGFAEGGVCGVRGREESRGPEVTLLT